MQDRQLYVTIQLWFFPSYVFWHESDQANSLSPQYQIKTKMTSGLLEQVLELAFIKFIFSSRNSTCLHPSNSGLSSPCLKFVAASASTFVWAGSIGVLVQLRNRNLVQTEIRKWILQVAESSCIHEKESCFLSALSMFEREKTSVTFTLFCDLEHHLWWEFLGTWFLYCIR